MTNKFNISGTTTGFPFNRATGLLVKERFYADYYLSLEKLSASRSKEERAIERAAVAWRADTGGASTAKYERMAEAAVKAGAAVRTAERRVYKLLARYAAGTV